jgi:hypothetical protein
VAEECGDVAGGVGNRDDLHSAAGGAAGLGPGPKGGADGGGLHVLAAVEGRHASVEFRLELSESRGSDTLVFFEQAKRFPDDLAGGGVAPRLHLVGDKRF